MNGRTAPPPGGPCEGAVSSCSLPSYRAGAAAAVSAAGAAVDFSREIENT